MERGRLKKPLILVATIIALGIIATFLFLYGNMVIQIIEEQVIERPLSEIMPTITKIILLLVGTEIFILLSRFFLGKYLEKRNRKSAKTILKIYSYAIWFLVLVLLLASFFKDVGALLTSIGLIGFGITFALQKPILNFVGWISIIVSNPFNIGDRIEVSGVRGDVVDIHTMYTRIQGTRPNTHEKSQKIITLPNEFILTNPVLNYSRQEGLYSDEVFVSITYESNWKKALELMEKTAFETIKKYLKPQKPKSKADKKSWGEAIKLMQQASKRIQKGIVKDAVKENIERLKSAETVAEIEIPKPDLQMALGGSSIDISIMYQTDLNFVRATKHEIVKNILDAVEKTRDIEIAYPHMQLVTEGKTGSTKKAFTRTLKSYLE
ncbi:MAG: mechanosensitive ion channel family protein [Candidatus Diapherotrites archaeon]|nr:mechanosensitive ion channel family protein [Candidatus Diapherotrites archaeon]